MAGLADPEAVLDATEQLVRDAAGLPSRYALHPPSLARVSKQADAMALAKELLARGDYEERQLGLFARDLSANGAKSFFVDTFAGISLVSGRHVTPRECLYEVISDGRPCWLYFDLEFSRVSNPNSDPEAVAREFYSALDRYFLQKLGSPHDPQSVVELDSTTPEKFSKHVLVKKLQSGLSLAFANNAHAGVLVSDLISSLRDDLESSNGQSHQLFFLDPKAKDGDNKPRVPLIDGCVYSRNRCFRICFSSKFGKKTPLLMSRGEAFSSPPALQLLSSLASFVPENTLLFADARIPLPLEGARAALKVTAPSGKDGRRISMQPVEGSKGSVMQIALQQDSPYVALFDFLCCHWDRTRAHHELGLHLDKTRVQSSVLVGDGRYLCVTLACNRFCFRKGASHKSNSIYLVVDLCRRVFYQKCHDVADCGRNFRSDECYVPADLLPLHASEKEEEEDGPKELAQAALSQAVEETQAVLSQAGLCDRDASQTLLVSAGSLRDHASSFLSQTLLLCDSLVEPTLIMSTPPAKHVWTSQDTATPEKMSPADESTDEHNELEVYKPQLGSKDWDDCHDFAPTVPDKVAINENSVSGAKGFAPNRFFVRPLESDMDLQRTQLDMPTDSEENSPRGTEVDLESELDSVPSGSAPAPVLNQDTQSELESVASGIALDHDSLQELLQTVPPGEQQTAQATLEAAVETLACSPTLSEEESQSRTALSAPAGNPSIGARTCKSIYEQLLHSDDEHGHDDAKPQGYALERHLSHLSSRLWSDSDDDKGTSDERFVAQCPSLASTDVSTGPPMASKRKCCASSFVDGTAGSFYGERAECKKLRM